MQSINKYLRKGSKCLTKVGRKGARNGRIFGPVLRNVWDACIPYQSVWLKLKLLCFGSNFLLCIPWKAASDGSSTWGFMPSIGNLIFSA